MIGVAIDVGGTFTDCLVMDSKGGLSQFKALTTPEDRSKGFLECLEKAARAFGKDIRSFIGSIDSIFHGTTMATNALLTERGAKVGMLTTDGFRDELEIRRGFKNIRTSMYNLLVPPYKPLVERYLRLLARERTLYTGEIETALDVQSVEAALEKFAQEKVGAVAVCFLHSYANPENEKKAAQICRARLGNDVYVTASHEILPVSGEYERFSTTVVSAYIGPIVSEYMVALQKRLSELGFKGNLMMVRSDGLVQSAEHSRRQAVTLINSGPAAAPTAARFYGGLLRRKNLISVDMGGTSFDVSLIYKDEIPTTTESWVGDERVAIKMVETHSIGAGGGSLAWIDSLGLLRVGPQSAGADPGPACYGRGGELPTVTDANVLLGYIPTDYFLGGEIALDAERSRSAIRKMAEPLKMGESEAAQAIYNIINSLMADQVIELSTKRGYDVRDFALVVGGGAGPVHGAAIAELLGVPEVVIPKYSALYSAFGMFAMDIGREYTHNYMVRADKLDLDRLESLFGGLTAQAQADLEESGAKASDLVMNRTAQMRYAGQFHEIEVPLPGRLESAKDVERVLKAFHARHKELYTFDLRERSVEFRTLSLRATLKGARTLKLVPLARGGADAGTAFKRKRRCLFGKKWIDTPCYDGARLAAGNLIRGPAIVEEEATTIVIPEAFVCTVDKAGSYLLKRR
ncbi:MAG: hydantoinase/oxoprolinase family protein [Betaproteobacteria bacterium]|nr:hydantoinase/oxoprolinase family protein [Betaproteobacteria bacterium]